MCVWVCNGKFDSYILGVFVCVFASLPSIFCNCICPLLRAFEISIVTLLLLLLRSIWFLPFSCLLRYFFQIFSLCIRICAYAIICLFHSHMYIYIYIHMCTSTHKNIKSSELSCPSDTSIYFLIFLPLEYNRIFIEYTSLPYRANSYMWLCLFAFVYNYK